MLAGRYEIVRELGRGGYSVVYLAHDRAVGAEVAVKLLVPPPAAAQLARERMRREVQAVRGLSHANIVAVYDFVEDGPWSFIVMEYVAGPDLQVRVRERGPLEADQAVRLGRDIAAALTAAHRRGILHRDVKPPNVLLEPDGRARLTDFGSARLDGQLGVLPNRRARRHAGLHLARDARRPPRRRPRRHLRARPDAVLRADRPAGSAPRRLER